MMTRQRFCHCLTLFSKVTWEGCMPHHWPNVGITITISKEYWSHFWWWNASQTTHFNSLPNCLLSPSKHWPDQKIYHRGFIYHTCPQPCIDSNRLLQFSSCELAACSLQKLQWVLNTAARIVSLWPKLDDIIPVLISLHWLPREHRIHYKVILFIFRCLLNLAPSYLSELLKFYAPELENLRSSDKVFLDYSIPSTKYGERAFSVSGSVKWNSMPDDIRLLDDIGSFKSKLKTWLSKMLIRNICDNYYYDSCFLWCF